MDLYGPRVEAASTRISTGWPYTATAATPNRTMDFMRVSRIQYQSTRKLPPGGNREAGRRVFRPADALYRDGRSGSGKSQARHRRGVLDCADIRPPGAKLAA